MGMLSAVGAEPALALYIFTVFLKNPVFQELLYDKSCLARYEDENLCGNLSYVYKDVALQKDANHLYLLSLSCLLLPSIPVSLILGSVCDLWSAKVPILIPFIGQILGDLNYILQCAFFSIEPHWVLASDIIAGFTGGYSAILGTMLSYGMKQQSDSSKRGYRMAFLEGSIGAGATCGFLLSGTVRERLGFAYTFLLMMALKAVCVIYIIFFVREIEPDHSELSTESSFGRLREVLLRRVFDVFSVLTNAQPLRNALVLALFALGVELFSYGGVNDIQYSFFRFQLQWGDKEYGWYSGVVYALGTLAVMTAYPLLRNAGVRDLSLCMVGILTKVVALIATAFVFSSWFAYATAPLSSLNRFVSGALRTTVSNTVRVSEQGKVFAVISFMEGITSLTGSLIFNSIYPLTLPNYSYLCFIVVAVFLIVPFLISWFLLRFYFTVVSPNSSDSSTCLNE